MPKLQMATPGDVRGRQHEKAADQIEQDSQIAPVEAVDQDAAEEGHEKPRDGHDDDLPTDLHRGMRHGEDVPAYACEVHAAAEERDEHGEKEVAEAALRPDQLPVDRVCHCSCHGTP